MTKPRILIVDDEPFNVDYLEQELEGADHETIVAVNGQEALDLVERQAPDLILLDIMMPVLDGFEVLSRLKANPATRNIPVIVISAQSDLRSVVRGIQLGAEDYLPKPFEPTLLHARVSSSLDKKRLRDLEQLYLKSLQREMDIAREIQLGFLPAELPQVAGWEIAAYLKAAHNVAGDFYDAFLLPDGHLACVIGDVCDKGVGAALFMTLFRSLIRATSTSAVSTLECDVTSLTPAERLRHVVSFTNNYLVEIHGGANMFATVFIGFFDLHTGTLSYINCGNEPPLWRASRGEITALKPTGPVMGVIPGAAFTVKEVTLDKNDLLLVFTDGIPDACNSADESFGRARLLTLLQEDAATPARLVTQIEDCLQQFIGSADQFDDITFLAIKRD
jgi:sigma-B regulation protein RsbU (phosphoserine phosphatase)